MLSLGIQKGLPLLVARRKHAASSVLTGDLESQLALFQSMDADGSGGLDKDEFVVAALRIQDTMFLQWIDHVLYQDVIVTEAEKLAQVCAWACVCARVCVSARACVQVSVFAELFCSIFSNMHRHFADRRCC